MKRRCDATLASAQLPTPTNCRSGSPSSPLAANSMGAAMRGRPHAEHRSDTVCQPHPRCVVDDRLVEYRNGSHVRPSQESKDCAQWDRQSGRLPSRAQHNPTSHRIWQDLKRRHTIGRVKQGRGPRAQPARRGKYKCAALCPMSNGTACPGSADQGPLCASDDGVLSDGTISIYPRSAVTRHDNRVALPCYPSLFNSRFYRTLEPR